MIKGPDPQTDKFLYDLAAINSRIDRAQRQITSGRRINSASDSPDEISHLLAVRSNLTHVQEIKANLGRVQTEVDTAEGSLGQAGQALDRILVLGTQGATDLATPESRATQAGEVDQLLGQIVNLSNSQVEGRYIFSGDKDQTAAYFFDSTQPDPVGSYQGSVTTRLVQHPSGQRFPVAKTADEIFDNADPTKNVFQNVNALRAALRANDTTAINAAVNNVRAAVTHLNNMQSFYGGAQDQVAQASDFASSQEVRLKTQISDVEDADVTSAILELNQSKYLQETALTAQSRRTPNSLFDYLK